jgi:8-oxo-dGTP diphosphatase
MMTMIRRREFACAILLDTLGRFLLQQRDNVPGIVHPGKIGLFGGQRESGETYLQCIVREVHEELTYFLPPERFEYVASYDATDIDPEGNTVIHGEFFIARGVPVERVTVTEGTLFIAELGERQVLEHRLSPSGKAGLDAFLERCGIEPCRRLPPIIRPEIWGPNRHHARSVQVPVRLLTHESRVLMKTR